MHLTHLPLLHTCPQCLMSYVRGGDDEGLHEKHHARVTRGIIWDGLGRGKKSGKLKDGGANLSDKGWRVIKENVPFGEKGKGRGKIIVADGSYGGVKVRHPSHQRPTRWLG
jgi:N-acetyltransferase